MKLDFLKDFEKRMKKVGAYSLISYNSFFKSVLKNFSFEVPAESTNLIYCVMLFIMEQSLKEENCTIDDITVFIEEADKQYFMKNLTFDECRTISDFIVNTVLCNNGEAMYFKGYNFERSEYEEISISLINNKTVNIDDIRRTSYYLTEDGYYLLLGTLEVESNLKITVQEMIFKLHLEKADYDKAIDDVKQLFNLSRIQLQRVEEGIRKIRENVLSFSPNEYDGILDDNIGIIEKQKKSFKGYKDYVIEREKELVENNIDIQHLNEEDERALGDLGTIKKYLSRVIDEHQRILNSHFDFKRTYSDALVDMTAFSAIKRISFGKELLEPILMDLNKLEALPIILKPIFLNKPQKYYNIKKCIEPQRTIREKYEDEEITITLDEASLKAEREQELRLRLMKYRGVLEILLHHLVKSDTKEITLENLLEKVRNDERDKLLLVPTVEIFREVMIELLKGARIIISELLKELQVDIEENQAAGFELNTTILSIIKGNRSFRNIKVLEVQKDMSGKELKIYGIITDNGYIRTVRCSNLIFKIET